METREKKVMHSFRFILAFAQIASTAMLAGAETRLTIATVNNADMIIMQKLSKEFEKHHPDIKLDWVILEENVLRERTTTDIATKGGQFDVLTIGTYETPIWGKRGVRAMKNGAIDFLIDPIDYQQLM